jgi:ketosteroid isomerase-like protein
MSQENVEIIRSGYDAFAQADLDALLALCEPGVELDVSDAFFDAPHTYRGYDGIRELIANQSEVFDGFRVDVEDVLDADDRVVAIVRAGGLARASGLEIFGRFGHLWTVRSGKAAHMKEYKRVDEALEAVGLSE